MVRKTSRPTELRPSHTPAHPDPSSAQKIELLLPWEWCSVAAPLSNGAQRSCHQMSAAPAAEEAWL